MLCPVLWARGVAEDETGTAPALRVTAFLYTCEREAGSKQIQTLNIGGNEACRMEQGRTRQRVTGERKDGETDGSQGSLGLGHGAEACRMRRRGPCKELGEVALG